MTFASEPATLSRSLGIARVLPKSPHLVDNSQTVTHHTMSCLAVAQVHISLARTRLAQFASLQSMMEAQPYHYAPSKEARWPLRIVCNSNVLISKPTARSSNTFSATRGAPKYSCNHDISSTSDTKMPFPLLELPSEIRYQVRDFLH
jgi:hypothetical protein